MINGLDNFFNGSLQALNLRAYRSEVLASNIANADTPHYKARDFRFTEALKNAAAGQSDFPITRTSARHLQGGTSGALMSSDLQYRIPTQPSIDGNTVELDTELAQFSDNALRFQANLTFLSSKIREYQTALQT